MSLFGERHSYKALLAFSDGKEGIVLALNFPFKLYGFYFSKLFPSETKGKYIQKQSYTPFGAQGAEAIKEIEKMVHKNFDGFEAFDNKYANAKVASIIIDGLFFEKLDLWQAFFTTNMFGII